MINVRAIPSLSDNYIWLITFGDRQTFVIDPGQAAPVLKVLKEEHLILQGILITHGCWDHVSGIEEVIRHHNAPVYGPANERVPHMTHPLKEGDYVNIDGTRFHVLDTRGHTTGHISFHGDDMLFCGDTLFGAGCGRLHTQRPDWMFETLKKIKQLPKETLIYCAHEYTLANLKFALTVEPNNPDTLKRQQIEQEKRNKGEITIPFSLETELLTNPFLRFDTPSVKAAAEHFSGQSLSTEADVFRITRYWKDTFG